MHANLHFRCKRQIDVQIYKSEYMKSKMCMIYILFLLFKLFDVDHDTHFSLFLMDQKFSFNFIKGVCMDGRCSAMIQGKIGLD